MSATEKRVCRFDGPTDRHYVEIVRTDADEYRVYRVRPFPPPTRGDKVDRFDVESYLAAVKLGAQIARDEW